jgi:hypothetical protein
MAPVNEIKSAMNPTAIKTCTTLVIPHSPVATPPERWRSLSFKSIFTKPHGCRREEACSQLGRALCPAGHS